MPGVPADRWGRTGAGCGHRGPRFRWLSRRSLRWVASGLVLGLTLTGAVAPVGLPGAARATEAAAAGGGPNAESAQISGPAQALERLFTHRPLQAEWFHPDFLAQVPLGQVQQIVDQLVAGFGGLRRVEPAGDQFAIVLERATVPARVALDGQGRFVGLFLEPPRAHSANLDELVADFQSLPGRVSVLVLADGQLVAALNPDEPLAVGSAFKLAVLAALRRQVEAGQRSWTDVVSLREEWKSLPSGLLQQWPAGSPLTLHTLATLMISASDNTAADTLIHVLGREAVEVLAPRNRPFLTTREAFLLKAPRHEAWLTRYRQAEADQRRALLAELAALPLPPASEWDGAPRALDVEWFFTARELCTLMQEVRDLPLMGVNPGLARAQDWAAIAFKGGSEPGVLNLTTGLVARDGRQLCVAATWNADQALDQTRFFALYTGLLDALR